MIRSGYGGRFWEDFKSGETIRHRLGRTVTQFDTMLFTTMAMNTASLHFDAEYASKTEWGKMIAPASMIISVVCGISSEDITMNLVKEIEFKDVKMTSPIFSGDTLHALSVTLEKKELPGRTDSGVVVVKTTGYKDEWNTTVCEFVRTIVVYKRGSSPRLKMRGQETDSV